MRTFALLFTQAHRRTHLGAAAIAALGVLMWVWNMGFEALPLQFANAAPIAAQTPRTIALAPNDVTENPKLAKMLPKLSPQVHAVSAIALPQGRLLAAWFGGTVEGAHDVQIYAATFSPITGWSPAKAVANRHDAAQHAGKFIRKLGNPVLHIDAKGVVHLFVTSVSLGGWAMATVEHFTSDNGGQSYQHQSQLPLSPFLNLSHLVRAPAIPLEDGGFVLPAYFEMGRKYAVLLHFDAHGRFLGRKRLGGDAGWFQPWPVVHQDGRLDFFHRDSGDMPQLVGVSAWQLTATATDPLEPLQAKRRSLSLRNPDASVSAVATQDGGAWLAHNPDTDANPWRTGLQLSKLSANYSLQQTLLLERRQGINEYSYPTLVTTDDGRIHLLYTALRLGIKHRVFEGITPEGSNRTSQDAAR